jgi:hypothetical protein
MKDPLTIRELFPQWRIDMGMQKISGSVQMSAFGEAMSVFSVLHYIRAVKGKHHVLVVFDRWDDNVAESAVEMLLDCDSSMMG